MCIIVLLHSICFCCLSFSVSESGTIPTFLGPSSGHDTPPSLKFATAQPYLSARLAKVARIWNTIHIYVMMRTV